MLVRSTRLLTLVAAGALACSDSAVTDPGNLPAFGKLPTAVDTTTEAPSHVNVTGQVLGVTVTAQNGSGDTLHYAPVAAATITLVHNVLVNGEPRQITVGDATTDADGRFHFDDVAGGYYIVTATPPAASGWHAAWQYLSAHEIAVATKVYVWK